MHSMNNYLFYKVVYLLYVPFENIDASRLNNYYQCYYHKYIQVDEST